MRHVLNTPRTPSPRSCLKIKPIKRGIEISLPVVRGVWKKAVGVAGGLVFIGLGSALGVMWIEIGKKFFSWLSVWEAILLASIAGIALLLVASIGWLFLTQLVSRRKLIISQTTVTLRDDSLGRKWTYQLDSITNVRYERAEEPSEKAALFFQKPPPSWNVLFTGRPQPEQAHSFTILCYEEIRADEAKRLVAVLSDSVMFHCHAVERIVFGTPRESAPTSADTLRNPDVATLTTPFFHLKQLDIHGATCDFYQLEQFLAYAVNYIGQAYFKKHVAAHVYGDVERLPLNVRNNLTHLCKQVVGIEQKEQ